MLNVKKKHFISQMNAVCFRNFMCFVCVILLPVVSLGQIATNGRVAFYPFSGNANDVVGGNNGTVVSAVLSPDRKNVVSSAYGFSGSAYINCASGSAFNSTSGDYSFSFWMQPQVVTNGYIISKQSSTLSIYGQYSVSLIAGKIRFAVRYISGSPYYKILDSGSSLTTNRWYHVCAVADSVVGEMRLYINGVSEGSISWPGTYYSGTAYDFIIGCLYKQDAGGYVYNFNGKIDEVLVYRRVLNQSEINVLAENLPPDEVSSLRIRPAQDQVHLSWSNPTNQDLAGVKVVRKTGSWPTNWNDSTGTIVYSGIGNSYVDNSVINGTTYFYAVYPYDTAGNHAQATQTRVNRGYAMPAIQNGEMMMDSDTVALWHFNGNANDSSPNGNHGTILGGVKVTNGVINTGYYFNGINGRVVVPISGSLHSIHKHERFTIEMWFNASGYPNDYPRLIDKGYGEVPNYGYHTALDKNKKSLLSTFYGASFAEVNQVKTNRLYYLVLTLENNFYKMYLNGRLLTNSTWVSISQTNDNPLWIGGSEINPSRYFKGVIDEIRISAFARSSNEIQQYWTMASNYVNWGITTPAETYEFVTKWGSQGSADGQFGMPAAHIDCDLEGNIYVVDYASHLIHKFSPNGGFIKKWGGFGTANGELNKPIGIAVGLDGSVYVADRDNYRIQQFTADGQFIKKWGAYGTGDGQFIAPNDIAVDFVGNIYVTDDELGNRVQKFTPDGVFLRKWGSPGTGAGQFDRVTGIVVDLRNVVYVCDYLNYRVQKFSTNGSYLGEWGMQGAADGQLAHPWGIAVDLETNIVVADQYNFRIQTFGHDGTYISKFGSDGTSDGQFHYPVGICIDPNGNLYVSDSQNYRIQKFRKQGFVPLTIPAGLAASDGSFSDKVSLSWTSIAGAETYQVFRSQKSNLGFTQIGSTAGTAYDDTTALAGTNYYYKVRAYAVAKGYSYLSPANTGYRGVSSIPSALAIVWKPSASVTTNSATILWNDLPNETSYTLFRALVNDTNAAVAIAGLAANVTNYTDTGLETDTTYYYWLKAYNGLGASGFSTVLSSKTAAAVIAAPPVADEPAVIIKEDFIPPGQQKKMDIGLNIDKAGRVTIEVYDIQGNLKAVICRDQQFDRGYHNVQWDISETLGSGVYWVVMKGEGWTKQKRVAVVR